MRQEMVWLDAQIRALELSNLRFLLSPRAQAAVPAFASILKLKGTELQQDVNALLARLTGLAGLEHHDAQDESGCEVHLVERYLFARATSIYGGSSEIQKEILAKSILG